MIRHGIFNLLQAFYFVFLIRGGGTQKVNEEFSKRTLSSFYQVNTLQYSRKKNHFSSKKNERPKKKLKSRQNNEPKENKTQKEAIGGS